MDLRRRLAATRSAGHAELALGQVERSIFDVMRHALAPTANQGHQDFAGGRRSA
jgi:hypothetical protein